MLATGHPEFDLLISHVHPDHFDLVSTLRFLKYHPSTVVVAPDRVSAQIRNALASNQQAASQVHAAPLKA
jgi:L-ascorbate metabolism protein UlaG (beta-lactamase superfamily)